MQHPVFYNRTSVSIYLGIWALIMGVHFSIFYFIYLFPLEVSAADSLVFNLIFSGAGISMWYIVRYSIPDQKNFWNVILNNTAFLTLILVVWNGLSYTLLSTMFSKNKAYMDLLMVSIPNKIISGIIFYIVIALIYYLFIYYNNLQEKVKIESRLRMVLKETELNMLKSQINPHFLFNSLNSISSLTITNPEKARDMVIKLSDFLRYSVSNNAGSFTTLEHEMANIRRYLEIEKVRFGEKLIFSFNLEGNCRNHRSR
jgi:two-component system LytT family sensor kinase